jgi:phosphatidylinositol alpha-1,6-mannosyltransferase
VARLAAAWYAAFAVYAAGVAMFSGLGNDRSWGIWATGGYAVAAILAVAWRSRGRQAALAAALAGALAGPLIWLTITAPATPDAAVVMRSGALLLHHATPYLSVTQLGHGGWLAYNPYLPAMALFGLPHGLGLPGLAGDPRPWLAAATLLIMFAAFRAAAPALRASAAPAQRGAATPMRRALFATASPVLAFPLALGSTDPPVLALTCLTLALLIRRRIWLAALVLGAACALKYTAWPALPVIAVMVATERGPRAALRFSGATLAAAVALAAALAPRSLAHPGALIQNTVAFPIGLTHARTPAQSPLPGHLLATIGPAGHLAAIAALVAAGLAVAGSLVTHPPADTAAAARRLALGLALMFALSPATRFGYFAYPAGLLGWTVLSQHLPSRPGLRPAASAGPDSVAEHGDRDAPAGADRNGRDHPRLRGHGAEG